MRGRSHRAVLLRYQLQGRARRVGATVVAMQGDVPSVQQQLASVLRRAMSSRRTPDKELERKAKPCYRFQCITFRRNSHLLLSLSLSRILTLLSLKCSLANKLQRGLTPLVSRKHVAGLVCSQYLRKYTAPEADQRDRVSTRTSLRVGCYSR